MPALNWILDGFFQRGTNHRVIIIVIFTIKMLNNQKNIEPYKNF